MITLAVEKKLLGAQGIFTLSVDISITAQLFLTLYGASGSGKTTLLRMLAGLETPDKGTIAVHGKVWFDSAKGINLPPQQRNVGMVFQDYALFPTMSVRENLRFAQPQKNEQQVNELLAVMGLTELADRLPATLSGGQQQRVALARAIVRKPDILLLDEPLSALDQATRNRLQRELLAIHRQFNLTTLLVSHDKQEVFRLADSVALLEHGTVIRQGTPREVFLDKVTSNKFSFASTILNIRKIDSIYLAVIGAGNELVEVVLTENDVASLHVGDEVLVASKAFNPIVVKL